MDEEINHLELWVYYFDVQIHVYSFNDVFAVNQWIKLISGIFFTN